MSVQTTYATGPAAAIEGQLVDSDDNVIVAMKNNEASAEIAFGRAVAFEGSTDDQGALLPLAANTPKLAGLVVHSHAYSKSALGDLGTTGIKSGGVLNVLRKGRIWARCTSSVVPGDRLFAQKTVNGGTRPLGKLDNAADGGNSIDATAQGVWMTTAAADGLAILEVDFTNKP